jgi:molybdenum ABC transporter molybdate-binding protein
MKKTGERRLPSPPLAAAPPLAALAACVLVLLSGCRPGAESEALTFYCAAGLKKPVEEVARAYEKECGTRVQIQYAGSGALLGQIQIAGTGDLYLAADDSYLDTAREKGLLAETIPLAVQRPVIAVARGNPKGIRGLDDLLRADVALSMANPEATAIGKITRRALEAGGLWKELEEAARAFKPTVNDVANDIRLGAVDAGIVWDATANQYPELESVRVEVFAAEAIPVSVGVLTSARNPTAALRFARFLTARDRGLEVFARAGYEVAEGDPWEEHPEVTIHAGAMLRPGLERTIKAFEEREGVTIRTVYNGCGILVAQMKAGDVPEAYFSCDVAFMEEVQDLFQPARVLTENDLVILVRKGNPKGLASLADLAREGLRVGLAHPQKSALGVLTRRLADEHALYERITRNIQVDSATGDFLVNQIRTGALDAVVVYRSNAMATLENLANHLDLVEIKLSGAVAVQPYAVARGARHQRLLDRFFAAVMSEASRQEFEAHGFRWRNER